MNSFPMMEILTETIPLDANERMHANLVFSTFYRERNQPEEAERYVKKSGVVPERAWWVLGPFDNVGGIDYNKVDIPEDVVEIDKTVTYEGKDGKISWEQASDETLIDRELQFTSDDHHAIPVTLRAGRNSIPVKLAGRQWGWGFHLWLTEADGFPTEGLEYMNSPTAHESVEE